MRTYPVVKSLCFFLLEYKYDFNKKSNRIFEPYLDAEEIDQQMAAGDVLRGVLRINRFRRQEAYVTTEEADDDIFIFGERARNRALEGSVVAVRLIDPEIALENRRRFFEKKQRQKEPDVTPTFPDEEEKPKRAGEVVGILEDVKNRRVVG